MDKMKRWIKPLLITAAVAAVLVLGGHYLNLQQRIVEALDWIKGLGPLGMGVFAGLYILACVFFIPGSLLTLGAGSIYGVVTGSILVSVSSTLGATAAFLAGRYVARNRIAKKIEGHARFSAIDDAVAKEGWRIVGLTRLSPIFSFNLLNYAYGLTRISLKEYVLASWLGMLPGTVMYVYLGSLAGDLAALGSETAEAPSAAQWAINILTFVATVLVTVYVTKIARKALATRVVTETQ
ncbi:TVP38/TMEM64 family protein [Pontiella agarivorans]|uniref:TVP38/TMEM64 family membrane protein n=1 Tax=Pontiella agarivorans TaxID=3038953 RepID=A0ABU5MVF6_9BACT|nr:TVP38/TMEM64 family protein [Pontiella agarivorans]MDZ8118221.1 TVP38/TMEM64 family protein [Pontiella agarivorans]